MCRDVYLVDKTRKKPSKVVAVIVQVGVLWGAVTGEGLVEGLWRWQARFCFLIGWEL